MDVKVEMTPATAYVKLEGVAPKVVEQFAKNLEVVEEAMLADAKSIALDHFHSVGKKPGLYLAAFQGGVKTQASSVTGYVRNANNLAHLLEYGFTISDLMIESAGVMKFALGGVGDLYRRAVHRHATVVQAYPAITPAFEAHKAEVLDAAQKAVDSL
jgi:hypothetical protein